MSRNERSLAAVVHLLQFALDVVVLGTAFYLTYLLRFDFSIPPQELRHARTLMPAVVAVQLTALLALGAYRLIWRYVGLLELRLFASAAFWSALALLVVRILPATGYPSGELDVSVVALTTLLGFGGVAGLRLLRRVVHENRNHLRRIARPPRVRQTPALFVGAGRAGTLAAREILASGTSDLEIRGFVDDAPGKQGKDVNGVRVLGTMADLPRLVKSLGIQEVVITISTPSRPEVLHILELCRAVPVKVRITPALAAVIEGRVKVSRVRDLEIEALLGRPPVELDEAELKRFLQGKTVMVTGAGGSIGSELCRQVARVGPEVLLAVDRAEFALFDAEQELLATHPGVRVVALVGDVTDVARMDWILSLHKPEVIFHAAAHKHVPMMETNAGEAVKNNVLGTSRLGELAGRHGVGAFVLISTDKAVKPTSVMGATKRIAELAVQDLSRRFPTRFVAVRFGNVIGSAGSVLRTFCEQIRTGGPVTVTHPDMERYFMTIPEAARLVLQAGAMGHGGEIFILDMGERVRILDLAEATIRLSGLRPYDEIAITFTGLRPGEKLVEELELPGEGLRKTGHPKIFIGELAGGQTSRVSSLVERLQALTASGDGNGIPQLLNEMIPEARISTGSGPAASPPGGGEAASFRGKAPAGTRLVNPLVPRIVS